MSQAEVDRSRLAGTREAALLRAHLHNARSLDQHAGREKEEEDAHRQMDSWARSRWCQKKTSNACMQRSWCAVEGPVAGAWTFAWVMDGRVRCLMIDAAKGRL